MRNVLLFLVVFALGTSALAGRGEQILQMSDDSIDDFDSLHNFGIAQWFEAPIDCHVVGASFFYRLEGTKDVAVWDNAAGSPDLPGALSGSVSYYFPNSNWVWSDYIDLTGLGLTVNAGDKFWVGIDYSPGYPHVGLDTNNPDYGHARTLNGTTWSFLPPYDLMVRVKINDDMDGPYANDQHPADGDTGVAVDADIFFDIEDTDAGVDSSTITTDSVVVTDNTKVIISGTLTIDDGNPYITHVTFDPDSDFTEGSVVTVTVSPSGNEMTDMLGNVMAEDSWSFTVFMTGVDSASLGEIKATFTEPECAESTTVGAETAE
ncbi:MAG: Ig-like domain-containing protein [bacterium]|nr:Ig-like domain-containing protein [bacterium]